MNEFLANLYGTAETIGAGQGSDTEKLAQAEVLNQMFESEGIDVNQLDPMTITKVANTIFGDANQIKLAEDEEEEEDDEKKKEKESADKLAEADYLGRVMAHSYVNELAEIEKQADLKSTIAKNKDRILETGKKVKEWAKKPAEHYKMLRKGTRGTVTVSDAMGNLITRDIPGAEGASKGQALLATLKSHKGHAAAAGGLGLAGAGALGGAGYGVHKLLKKKESALDVLAEQRALEILNASGYGNEQEKLAAAVDNRALQLLREAGYDV